MRAADHFDSPGARTPGPEPTPLGDLLDQVRRRRGWQRRLHGARVHERWPAIAGQQLARHVEPVRLDGGVLVLRAESSAWATQVRYLSSMLVVKANEVLGEGSVTAVRLVTGTVGVNDPEHGR